MPETSIVIKAEDRYSSAVKSMTSVTKSFSKDADELDATLEKLRNKKVELKIDISKVRAELKTGLQAMEGVSEEMKEMDKQAKLVKLERLQDELNLVNKAANATKKQIEGLDNQMRKTGNSVGGGFAASLDKTVSTFVKTGGAQMISSMVQQGANVAAASLMGSAGGSIFSSALSTAISGAAIGNAIAPGIGTAVGAAAGTGVGLVSGALQVFSSKDDAFKSYVQEAVTNQLTHRESDLSSGSSIAATRQTDLVSFSTLFGSRQTAEGYLKDLVTMSNTTPFLYGDLTAMSKTLATYGYGAEGILPVLRTIGDTGAALGLNTSDMTTVAQALGRMKSSNKTTLEYLNILNDRGVGAVGILADSLGVDQGTVYDMVSKGQIEGGKAVEMILASLTKSFAGSMLAQSKTFAGLSSTLEGLNQEQQNAYGEGYNAVREKGLAKQVSYLSSAGGERQKELNSAIGAFYASLENEKEAIERRMVQATMNSAEYKAAMALGTDEGYAEAGRLLMEAKVKAQNEYNATDGAKLLRESELAMIQEVRADTALDDAYWDAGYQRGQEYSKGIMAGLLDTSPLFGAEGLLTSGPSSRWSSAMSWGSHAYGLERVPYDNYPALLHQGERVLTASEARAADRGKGTVSVQIGQVTFGADIADPKAAAEVFAEELKRALLLAVPT